jgi:hypothetical protein
MARWDRSARPLTGAAARTVGSCGKPVLAVNDLPGQPVVGSGGSQGPSVKSWVRASRWSSPCLAAVDKQDQMTA